jgi:hypothetical protein
MPGTASLIRVDPSIIQGLLADEPISSPWAVLKVQFSDQHDAWPAESVYEDLFTSTGSGKENMVDFFRDMSHGKIDLSGSELFGPYTLTAKRSDYGVTIGRNDVLNLAKTAATSSGVNLSNYAGVLVTFLGQVDLCGWVGGMAALCDTLSLQPSLLGQEMGHGYGLDHARIYGSSADYQDPWDVMSTANAYEEPNAEFTDIGPGMNAWEMRSRGWLDESRVWKAPTANWDALVDLRPLHRTDLDGFLAAEIGPYLVEFRVTERWDAAIPRPCVLVHSFLDNHSYLMYSYTGSRDIVEGDKFQFGDPNNLVFGYYEAEVVNIDQANETATVRLHARPAQPRPVEGLIGEVLGGVAVDGGGAVIIGGKIIKVPPYGPLSQLVADVAHYMELEISTNDAGSILAARREALQAMTRSIGQLYADASPISENPPGYAPENAAPGSRTTKKAKRQPAKR